MASLSVFYLFMFTPKVQPHRHSFYFANLFFNHMSYIRNVVKIRNEVVDLLNASHVYTCNLQKQSYRCIP